MENFITGLDHIGIKVKDKEKSVQFYTGVLGLKVVNRTKLGNKELIFLKYADITLELVEIDDGSIYYDGVVNHLAFKVRDIFAAVEYLRSKAVESISSDPVLIGSHKYNYFFRGPDGEKLELIQD